MSKQNFYDFAMMMANDSKLLFEANRLHNSVYLGGYVLEAYIKILLLNSGHQYKEIKQHLGDEKFKVKIKRLLAFYPELFENSLLFQKNKNIYPKSLFNGGSNKITEAKWNVNQRYNKNQWSEESFCKEIQKELENIKKALIRIQREGILL